MSGELNQALMEFKPDDYSVRLVGSVLGVLPGAPSFNHWPNLAGAVNDLGVPTGQARGAMGFAGAEPIADVLWMSRLLDKGDKGYAIFTGARSAVRFFFGDRAKALDTDAQQRNDAVLKSLGLAYMAWKAFDGTVPERAAAFRASQSGQAMIYYYAAIEVGLPFADNALLKGGAILEDLFGDLGSSQVERLAGMAGGRDLGGVQEMLTSLSGALRAAVDSAAPYIEPVANAAKTYLPGALDTTDKLAGAVAGAADILPVYRLLGGRLAAEAAILKAG
jgi:hypothetical protein